MTELTVETAHPEGDGVSASLTVRGDLDQDTAEEFLDAFRAALPDLFAEGGRVLLDCAQVGSCDYAGLSALLMARREAADVGAQLVLTRQSRQLADLLSVAGVGDLLSQQSPPTALGDGAAGAASDPDAALVALDWVGGVPVVTLAGQVDLDSFEDITAVFAAAAEGAAEGAQAGRTVVALSRLEFADSTILNVLLKARAASDLWLVGPLHPQVRLLFQVTDLLGEFRFVDDLGEALGVSDRSL